MKKRLSALAGGIILVATLAKIITIPAVAQTIRATFVKNIDEKGRNPYSQSFKCKGFGTCVYQFPPIPAGMRLVVGNINVRAFATGAAPGISPGDVLVSFSTDGISSFYFPATKLRGSYVMNASLTAYADCCLVDPINLGKVSPLIEISTDTGTVAGAEGQINGYLVNLNN